MMFNARTSYAPFDRGGRRRAEEEKRFRPLTSVSDKMHLR